MNPEMSDDTQADGNGWLGDFLPYQIYRVSSLMNIRLSGRLKASGINLSQWRVLSVLRSQGQMSMSQIVDRTLMEQPTISRVISQLHNDGMVEREISPEDSRVALVSLSERGRALFDEIAVSAVRHQKIALDGVSKADIAALRRALSQIEANISEV
ncbi:MarR family winged helix-turn-helix transcriptional regulator [Novosphingobium sp. KACC 22771]|uniref:MarR family winged helix-turn-helix transcriptional regulator n=1 Tax=Novosphingobium sp. KACC 22771 TaxID=3025670 RepID=UPI0023664D61|nr:MarR family winged helix-turn-helix transcriptional regulator [Novosphingobium sp. KACC 22771]WDF74552.1 MarR family winged helix-turn-helix transcriptional regulator [Novosphingobium sp. KACC 22771]